MVNWGKQHWYKKNLFTKMWLPLSAAFKCSANKPASEETLER